MGNEERIIKTLDCIHAKVTALVTWKAVHTKSHEQIDRDIKEVRGTLFHNAGIVDKVRRLWDCRLDSVTRSTVRQKLVYGILRGLSVAAIVALTVLIFKVVKWLP